MIGTLSQLPHPENSDDTDLDEHIDGVVDTKIEDH